MSVRSLRKAATAHGVKIKSQPEGRFTENDPDANALPTKTETARRVARTTA